MYNAHIHVGRSTGKRERERESDTLAYTHAHTYMYIRGHQAHIRISTDAEGKGYLFCRDSLTRGLLGQTAFSSRHSPYNIYIYIYATNYRAQCANDVLLAFLLKNKRLSNRSLSLSLSLFSLSHGLFIIIYFCFFFLFQ